MPEVSVVVPSLGEASCAAAVASVLRSGRRAGIDTEVIVVRQQPDAPHVPGAIVVPAHRVNVSYARNRGAEAATAPLLGYVDEDEVVDTGWVVALVAALADADAAFGPIDPIDADGRPHCLTHHGDARVFAPGTPPWLVGSGGNMVFRRTALTAVGGFDLRFGAGAIGRSAEETELIWRLLDAGRRIRWAPDMIVHHPTKTDAEILASRYPYGFGSGRMLRRSRSARLTANYLAASAQANAGALRRRDPVARREAAAFGHGLISGLLRRPTWCSPDLAAEEVPPVIRAAVDGRRGRPLAVSWGARPHYVWDFGDAVLHAYIGPTAAQIDAVAARERVRRAPGVTRIPAVRAHARGRDALWLLEDRVEGVPLEPGAAVTWWPGAVAWVLSYCSPEGPPAGLTAAWSGDTARWLEGAPPELRGAVADAVARSASRPTGPTQGDLQPKNLLMTPDGVAALDWEWCGTEELRGLDIVFLAATHAGVMPDHEVMRGLLEGRDPAFGDVLGPLRTLGLEGLALQDTLLLLLVKWATDEHRRVSAVGASAPSRQPYGEMLAALTPVLLARSAAVSAAA